MTGKTRAEYEQEIADLRAANEALLDGHAKMSTAYLSLRLTRIEEEFRELRLLLNAKDKDRHDYIERLSNKLNKLESQIGGIEQSLTTRLDAAADQFTRLKKTVCEGNGHAEGSSKE